MFMAEIAGVRILYTGDYSRYPDRHLMGAETPDVTPDVLIVESTYGIAEHERREDREARFLGWVPPAWASLNLCVSDFFFLVSHLMASE